MLLVQCNKQKVLLVFQRLNPARSQQLAWSTSAPSSCKCLIAAASASATPALLGWDDARGGTGGVGRKGREGACGASGQHAHCQGARGCPRTRSLPGSTPSPLVSWITASRRPASGLLLSCSRGTSPSVKSSLGRWLQVASALSGPTPDMGLANAQGQCSVAHARSENSQGTVSVHVVKAAETAQPSPAYLQ